MGKRFGGVTGQIKCNNYEARNMKIAYVPQTDKLYEALTVSESVIFSSRLQNS